MSRPIDDILEQLETACRRVIGGEEPLPIAGSDIQPFLWTTLRDFALRVQELETELAAFQTHTHIVNPPGYAGIQRTRPPQPQSTTAPVPAPSLPVHGRTFNWPAGQHKVQLTCALPRGHGGYCRSADGKGPRNEGESRESYEVTP